MRTDILGHPPSLCTYRRVWHPCHTHAPSQGVHLSPLGFAACQSKKCTNRARTAPTKLPLHPPTARDFCAFCAFCGITRTLTICVDLCHLWENTIMAGGVGMAGMPYPPKCVLWAVHLCSVGAAETAAPPNIPCIPWEDTAHPNLL